MDVMNYVDDDLMGGATGTDHKLTVDPEVIEYLALATKQRLRVMTERMICASQHRRKSLETHSPPLMYDNDHPMFRIQTSQNVKKQLLAIERAEREEELKRKQHVEELRVESLTASKAQVRGILRDVGESGKRGKKAVQFQFRPNPKRKAKEPKVVLTEMQGLKFANQAALAFAEHRGRESTYAWMTAGGGILKRPLKLASAETTADGAVDLLSPSSSPGSGGSFQPLGRSVAGLCDTNIPLVSVKDALFCLENEHGGKGAGLKVLVKHYIK
ncbi:hypothetical protein EC991_000599 [Linnemannia zychae]|nr:hypothetical protein EC991_000599 [Linnemannia zychae]